jgi:hypothetical protein
MRGEPTPTIFTPADKAFDRRHGNAQGLIA